MNLRPPIKAQTSDGDSNISADGLIAAVTPKGRHVLLNGVPIP